jgi:hypothetical protein
MIWSVGQETQTQLLHGILSSIHHRLPYEYTQYESNPTLDGAERPNPLVGKNDAFTCLQLEKHVCS